MPVSRLAHIPGIGVDEVGDAADATGNPNLLRLENLDTDVPPPAVAREITRAAVDDDDANSYLPFQGHRALREAAAGHVGAMTGTRYDPGTECVSVAGGLNGILNVLLATVEPGQEVVIADPIYAGLVNRIRLAGGVSPARAVRSRCAGLGHGPGRARGGDRAPDGRGAADGPGHADRRGPVGRALRRDRRPGRPSRRLGHLGRRDGTAGLRRQPAGAPRRAPGPGRPHDHGGLRLQGTADDRLARGLGGRPPADHAGHRPGRPDQRRLPGRHRPAGRGRGAAAPGRRGGRGGRHPRVARPVRAHPRSAQRLPCIRPDGGWSLLVDARPLGPVRRASRRLFTRGEVAATPMDGWGPSGERYLRLVFANEAEAEHLAGLGDRFRRALG